MNTRNKNIWEVIVLISLSLFVIWSVLIDKLPNILIFLAFVPCFWVLKKNSLKSIFAFIIGNLVGFTLMATSTRWLWYVSLDPISDFFSNPSLGRSVAIIAWLIIGLLSSLFTGIWFVVANKIIKKTWALIPIVFLPLLWVFIEYTQSLTISLVSVGRGTFIGPFWSLNILGYQLAGNEWLLRLASFGGVFLLSYLIITINLIIIFLLIKYKSINIKNELAITTLIVVIVIMLFPFQNRRDALTQTPTDTSTDYLKVILLDPNYDLKSYGAKNRLLKEIFYDSESNENILLVLPEGNLLFIDLLTDNQLSNNIHSYNLTNSNLTIIDSGNRNFPDNNNYGLVYEMEIQPKGEINVNSLWLKKYPVPLGEYIPWLIEISGKLLNKSESLKNYRAQRELTSGKLFNYESKIGKSQWGDKIKILQCSEILTQNFWPKDRKEIKIIINPASYVWFDSNPSLFRQIQKIATIHSVVHHAWFIHANDIYPSYIINPKGKTLEPNIKSKLFNIYYLPKTDL